MEARVGLPALPLIENPFNVSRDASFVQAGVLNNVPNNVL
jgi:hypothetical protein